jgi:hypothetical protein
VSSAEQCSSVLLLGMQDLVVQLQTPAGQTLSLVEHDQQRLFVGEPGQEFVVAVTGSANTSKTLVVRGALGTTSAVSKPQEIEGVLLLLPTIHCRL